MPPGTTEKQILFHLDYKYSMSSSKCYCSDHVSLQVGEGRQVKDALDEVGRARLAEPQKHGVAVLQQEHAGVCQTLLRTTQRSRQGLAVDIHVVLKEMKTNLLDYRERLYKVTCIRCTKY